MTTAYFAPLVTLPNVITAPGKYVTRKGEKIDITSVSASHDFDCIGYYSAGTKEFWHKSGRLYATLESHNDIVAKV